MNKARLVDHAFAVANDLWLSDNGGIPGAPVVAPQVPGEVTAAASEWYLAPNRLIDGVPTRYTVVAVRNVGGANNGQITVYGLNNEKLTTHSKVVTGFDADECWMYTFEAPITLIHCEAGGADTIQYFVTAAAFGPFSHWSGGI